MPNYRRARRRFHVTHVQLPLKSVVRNGVTSLAKLIVYFPNLRTVSLDALNGSNRDPTISTLLTEFVDDIYGSASLLSKIQNGSLAITLTLHLINWPEEFIARSTSHRWPFKCIQVTNFSVFNDNMEEAVSKLVPLQVRLEVVGTCALQFLETARANLDTLPSLKPSASYFESLHISLLGRDLDAITFPALRMLRLAAEALPTHDIIRFLDKIKTPALQDLTILSIDYRELVGILPNIICASRYPLLRRISINALVVGIGDQLVSGTLAVGEKSIWHKAAARVEIEDKDMVIRGLLESQDWFNLDILRICECVKVRQITLAIYIDEDRSGIVPAIRPLYYSTCVIDSIESLHILIHKMDETVTADVASKMDELLAIVDQLRTPNIKTYRISFPYMWSNVGLDRLASWIIERKTNEPACNTLEIASSDSFYAIAYYPLSKSEAGQRLESYGIAIEPGD